uniref:Ovule protein n=1 Tax=Strongyloides papillosus TaxID=174720 RepID=A0A0N5CJ04_STREA
LKKHWPNNLITIFTSHRCHLQIQVMEDVGGALQRQKLVKIQQKSHSFRHSVSHPVKLQTILLVSKFYITN